MDIFNATPPTTTIMMTLPISSGIDGVMNGSNSSSHFVDSESKWTDRIIVAFFVDLCVFLAGIVLNVLGIVLICLQHRRGKEVPSQQKFLVQLSVTAIISQIGNLMAVVLKCTLMSFPKAYVIIYYIDYIAYIATIVLLTTDRVIMAARPLQYKSIVTPTRVHTSIGIAWLISVAYGLVLIYARVINRVSYSLYSSYVYNGFIIMYTLVSYAFITVKVMQSTKASRNNPSQNPSSSLQNTSSSPQPSQPQPQTRKKMRKFLMPFCIVVSFLVFQSLPPVLLKVIQYDKEVYGRVVVVGMIGVNMLNNVSDPLIYIIAQKTIRKQLVQFCERIRGRQQAVVRRQRPQTFSTALDSENHEPNEAGLVQVAKNGKHHLP